MIRECAASALASSRSPALSPAGRGIWRAPSSRQTPRYRRRDHGDQLRTGVGIVVAVGVFALGRGALTALGKSKKHRID